jgi:acyl transferase domain-containing protein/SAM-dependent methyltransferase
MDGRTEGGVVNTDRDELLQRALTTIAKLREKLASAGQPVVDEPIAIVGAACEFPGAIHTLDDYWELLTSGRCAIGPLPPSRRYLHGLFERVQDDGIRARATHMGLIDDPYGFDNKFFGISPKEALELDPQHRLLLELAWKALESACINPLTLRDSDTGVFVGIGNTDYYQSMVRHGCEIDAYVASGNAPAMAAGRLSYFYGLKGPCLSFDTACSSSLVGIQLACRALQRGDCQVALVGAVNLILSEVISVNFALANMLAADGRCKVFSDSADGYVRAEGAAVLILKKLSQAWDDGDPILAVIRAANMNQDGRSHGLTAPNGPSQRALIERTLADANLSVDDIDYLEAHGTGTKLGDPVEVNTLLDVFAARKRPLLVGSAKANVGHLEPASGMASVLKVICSMRHGEIPGQPHCSTLNREIDWARAPVVIPRENTPWPIVGEKRIAAISGFGFSGTNAHVILESPPPRRAAEQGPEREWIFTVSSADAPSLRRQLERHRKFLSTTLLAPGSVSFSACAHRAHFPCRFALSYRTLPELVAGLRAAELDPTDAGVEMNDRGGRAPGLVVGSKFSGSLGELIRTFHEHPVVRATLSEVNAAWVELRGTELLLDGSNGVATVEGAACELEEFCATLLALRLLEAMGLEFPRFVAWGTGFIAVSHQLGHLDLRSALALADGDVRSVRSVKRLDLSQSRLSVPGVEEIGLDVGDWLAIGRSKRAELAIPDAGHGSWVSLCREPVVCSVECRSVPRWATLNGLLVALYRAGIDVDWKGYFAGSEQAKVTLPSYEFSHTFFNAAEGRERDEPAVARGKLASLPSPDVYTDCWRPAPVSSVFAAVGDLGDLVRGLGRDVELDGVGDKYRRYCRMVAEAESLCERAALHLFKNAFQVGSRADLEAIATDPRQHADGALAYTHLIVHLAKYMLSRGRDADDFSVLPESMGPALAAFARRHSEFVVDNELLSECVGHLVDIMKGVKDPKTILFSGGAASLASRVYKSSVTNDYLNKQIQILVRGLLKHHSGERKLRILEVGAGTGATTQMVARELDPARVEYCFTDISPFFLSLAEQEFGKYGCFEFQILNIEDAESVAQLAGQRFDVIIAVNVLHATSSIEQSVRNVCELLLDGGVFILRECIKATLTADLTFGLTPGWWAYTDYHVRKDYPLLDCSQWGALLRQNRFRAIDFVVAADDVYDDIIVSRKAAPVLNEGRARMLVVHGSESSLARFDEPSTQDVRHIALNALLEQDVVGQLELDKTSILNVVLGGLEPLHEASAPPDVWIERYFHDVVAALQRLATLATQHPLRVYFLTRRAVSIGDGDPVDNLGQALTWGLARAAAREYPQWYRAIIDVDTESWSSALKCLALEAGHEVPEQEVVYRQGRRHVRRLGVAPPSRSELLAVRASAAYLITGGRGGLGLATALWLAERGARHLVLLSRGTSGVQPHQVGDVIWKCRAAGATVELCSADVSNRSELEAVFKRFGADLPPLGGIIHSAGVGGNCLIRDIGRESLPGMFATKVLGSLNLHELSKRHAPDFFIVYSSMIATWGAVERAHYTAVNHFSDQLMRVRHALGLPGLALQWGPWSGAGMLSKGAETQAKWLGVDVLEPEQYLTAFGNLTQGHAQGVRLVVKAAWQRLYATYSQHAPFFLLDELRRRQERNGHAITAPSADEGELDAVSTRASIRAAFAELLGYTNADEIDETRGFFEQGMDSLLAVRFTELIHERIRIKVKTTDLFSYNNVVSLTEHVASKAEPKPRQSDIVTKSHSPAGNRVEHRPGAQASVESLSPRELIDALTEVEMSLE